MSQQQFSTNAPAGNGVVNAVVDAKDNLVTDGTGAFQRGVNNAGGLTALAVLRSFVVPVKVSLVDKLTGKGALIKKVANSAYGSLAIAATFHVVSSVVGNEKLAKIAKLALDAALIEAAANLPIQAWVDKVASKLFSNPAISNLLGDDKADSAQ